MESRFQDVFSSKFRIPFTCSIAILTFSTLCTCICISAYSTQYEMKGRVKRALCQAINRCPTSLVKINVHRLFDWRPEPMRGEPLKCERVVIIKNLFSPEDFDKDVALILEYQQDLRSECTKCGDVKKVVICDVSSYYSYYYYCDRQ